MKRPELPEGGPIQVYLADANVLYSRSLRDYLLYAMRARLITIRWSQTILGEMNEHLMENRPSFTQESADRLARAMTVTFPYAQVDPGPGDFAKLVGIELPDKDDRHVIAAALAAEATPLGRLIAQNYNDTCRQERGQARPAEGKKVVIEWSDKQRPGVSDLPHSVTAEARRLALTQIVGTPGRSQR